MKIVLSGGWSYGNIGDEAIAKSTVHLLEKYFPEAELILYSYDQDNFYYHHNRASLQSIHKIVDSQHIDSLDILPLIMENSSKYGMDEFEKHMDENTLFIMGGGGYFNTRWNTMFISRIIEIELAHKNGAKIALIGQSIGPIDSNHSEVFTSALRKCDYINVRDADTENFIKSLLPDTEIYRGADTAIIISDVYEKDIKRKENVVSVMAAGYSTYVPIEGNKIQSRFFNKLLGRLTLKYYIYEYKLMRIIKELVEEDQAFICFTMSTDWDFDIAFTKRITKRLKKENYEIIKNPTVDTLCEKLMESPRILSSKMHPIIISASYGVEGVAISYNFKIDNFMASLDSSESCYRNDKLNKEQIVEKLKNKTRSSEYFISNVEKAKKSVYDMMEYMVNQFEDTN